MPDSKSVAMYRFHVLTYLVQLPARAPSSSSGYKILRLGLLGTLTPHVTHLWTMG